MEFFKKNVELRAICAGSCAPLSEMPDEAFASELLGRGVVFHPSSGLFFSPCDCRVESVAETGHAVTLHTNEGAELLIHVGVDTVSLKGEGFRPLVKAGEQVEVGTPILQADLELIRQKGLPTATALVISNPEIAETIECRYGEVEGGHDVAILCRMARKG